MKKKLLILLALVCLLTAVLPGCKSGGEPAPSEPESSEVSSEQPAEIPTVNILVDLVNSRPSSNSLTNLLYSIKGCGTEFNVLTETTPYDTQERDAMLTRVKTEIMAGKGPDIFLCENPASAEGGQGLFPFPQKTMKNHLLLPLDSYIENTEYMEMDKLLPVVMEAGRNEEGQQILPMSFSFSITAYNREQFTLTEELPVTWDEAVTSEDPMVRFAATAGHYRDISGAMYATYSGLYRDTFAEIADEENDRMLVTEEEIARRMGQLWELDSETDNGMFPEFTELNEELGRYTNKDRSVVTTLELGSTMLDLQYDNCLGGQTEYWLVPRYNTEGGITANVESFAAINRNTKHPEESFRVLDMLLSYNGQKSGFAGLQMGMPVHMDVGMDGQNGPNWSMNDWNAGQYQSLLGQINSVRFTTPVEQEFSGIYPDYSDGRDWSDIVHRHYMKMQMMLAES